jgi:SAM-dependent methyltransferase
METAMEFKDYFSSQSGDYAKYRPNYPAALFTYLASLPPAQEYAWDCGTGNGQAALGLAPYFSRVIATDPSAQQIRNAVRHDKISYKVATAEETKMEPRSVDLITVAQALHWFDLDRFYAEVKRVLKPQGVLAVWCYGLFRISPPIDKVLYHYYADVVGPYWPLERKLVDEKYQTIPFPFAEISAPRFTMEVEWNLADLVGYLGTWSAAQQFEKTQGVNPLLRIEQALISAWQEDEKKRTITWPVYLRIGRHLSVPVKTSIA